MDSTDAIRLLIVANAYAQAFMGAHYLNGSDGGFPGKRDGYKNRNVQLVERSDFDEVAIHTAVYSKKSCRGRCNEVGGATYNNSKAKLDEVKEYCQKNLDKGLAPEQWEAFENGLYPRRFKPNNSKLFIGEDCRDKRHFDCISFVNWVLTTTLKKSFKYSIRQYEGKKEGGGVVAPVKTYRNNFPDPQNADILTRIKWEDDDGDGDWEIDSKHIGFYVSGGKVIEAKGSREGVVVSNYKRNKWTGLCRLKKGYLKIGA